ncbi:MAG TPA: N-acetylmuramoyl-L-alanine amidase [Streptosporangiaceae bacterium]
MRRRPRVGAPHIVGLCGVALATTAASIYVFAGGSPANTTAGASGGGSVHTIALRDMAASTTATGSGPVRGLPATATKPFSLVGVTWDDAHAGLLGSVQVRARNARTGAWSSWQAVQADEDDAPDPRSRDLSGPGARGGSAPLWVGPSNGVEVRVAGRRTLPAGLRVDLVDPYGNDSRRPGHAAGTDGGTGEGAMTPVAAVETADPSTGAPSAGDASTGPAQPSASAEPSGPVDSAPASTPAGSAEPTSTASAGGSQTGSSQDGQSAAQSSTAPRPTILARSSWGADESLVKDPPEYSQTVKVVFVHHTAGTNSYACADSPSIIRSVFLYHVKSEGWNDIGYNFLVDKCGTIFEGRAGGVDRPVLGAQTYGFNTDSTGVSVLGTYTSTAPSQAAVDSVARVAAWKLGLHGGDPTGKATLTERAKDGKFPYGTNVSFNTISGHRDGFATECPGDKLYAKLGAIRTEAKQWMTPLTSVSLSGLGGAAKVGSTYYTKGAITPTWKPAAASEYAVLVDGATAAQVAGSATSAKVTLSPGSHTLQVRATNLDGTTVTSPSYAVVADATRPVFGKAATLALRTGSVSSAGTSPVVLGWKVTDDTLLRSVKSTSPTARTFATTGTSWYTYAKANTSLAWTLAAADAAGNTATSSVTRTASIYHETSSTRTGTWKSTTGSSYLGGKAYYSGSKGATASYTFTGRAVGLIVRKAASAGAFTVYVDGVKTATVDARASSTVYRQIVWTKNWSGSAKHTVKIVVAATSGHPYVVTDGIAYIK